MAEPSTAVARRVDPDSPAGFRQQLRQNADKITLPQGISKEAFENVVFSATVQNPDLLKADRQSLLLACLKAAQDGLLPNGREAALVVFSSSVKEDGNWVTKKLVQYMPMVGGLRSKIFRAVNPSDGEPLITKLEVGVVYKIEADEGYFRWERGTTPEVQHTPMLDIKEEEATDENIIAAYSIATFKNGIQSCEVMRRFEIDKVRQVSQTGALGKTVKFGKDQGKAIPPKGPWVDWFAEMAKKTVLRRHSKVLPMAGDIITFEANDEAAEFRAADNANALLSSAEPDAPVLEDRSDETETAERERIADEEGADRETGELPAKETKPEPEKKAASKAKAKPDEQPSAEGNASSGPAETDATTRDAAPSDASVQSSTNGATQSEPEELLADPEMDALKDRMDKAELVVDLERIYDDAEAEINARDGDVRAAILLCYSGNLRRLGKRAKEPAQ